MPRPCFIQGAGRPSQGFTIIELMVVVILVGIVAAMSYSGWTRVMWRVKAFGAADEFRGALLQARSDAVVRKRHSGVFFDLAGQRYLRFVDSSAFDEHDGRFSPSERVLQAWTALPRHLQLYSLQSSIGAPVVLRPCGGSLVAIPDSPQMGAYSIVFTPEGRSMATLHVEFGVEGYPNDTFRIDVLPPTGLVTLEH
ncbi:MAG: prepilin-type N-terminal cleavage/methylation domain-containing protein [Fibrobacteria bacterium]|nr:prepilin-type N-terminal cleavage/methylation domain-containing protein [Fibrobacteria bacterium]